MAAANANEADMEEAAATISPKPSKDEEEKRKRNRREKMKKKLLKEAEKSDKKGVCYLSRIPPKMDPTKLRQLLSPYGELLRVYLAPEDPEAGIRRKKSGGFRGQEFSEGWVEFADKRIAKRVANMLNGEQIGGKKRSQFFYDTWNIKYLSKFKWEDLTDDNARKKAIRENKLRMELTAAKKERDFYMSKVEKSRALSEIEERVSKKRKNQSEQDPELPVEQQQQKPKVFRQFSQKRPLADSSEKNQPTLSKDVLAAIFNKSTAEA